MEYSHDETHFSTANCDTCGSTPTVMLYNNGTPCLAQCKGCMPEVHERTARQDIDAWLNGGNTYSFGR